MFSTIKIEKLLSEIIPSASSFIERRCIWFILKKNVSANCKMLIFSGTNEELCRVTAAELIRTDESKSASMLESQTGVK
jgi:hypothetical protein